LIGPSEKSLAPDMLPYSTENYFEYLDCTVFQKMVLYVALNEWYLLNEYLHSEGDDVYRETQKKAWK